MSTPRANACSVWMGNDFENKSIQSQNFKVRIMGFLLPLWENQKCKTSVSEFLKSFGEISIHHVGYHVSQNIVLD